MLCASCGEQLRATAECATCGRSPLLDERYRLEEVLGRSARGTTYRATRIADDKIVAIKELPLALAADTKAIELAEREARVLRQLRHGGVPQYFDDFKAGLGKRASYYIAMELVDGVTLAAEQAEHRHR